MGKPVFGTLTVLDLAGAVALLLWGVHMVQSGVQRAFGNELDEFCRADLADGCRLSLRAEASPRFFKVARRPPS